MKLPSVGFRPIDPSLIPENVSKLPRAQKRIMELLKKGSETPLSSAGKTWSLDFQLSPASFNDELSSDELTSVTFERTHLRPHTFDPSAKVEGSGEMIDLPAAVAFRAIGYKSKALEELSDLDIPFDDRLGIIPNDEYGRILNSLGGPAGSVIARHVPGMYCAGWVKRGPTGVIATAMNDAFSTAEVIAEDWYSRAMFNGQDGPRDGWDGLREEAGKRGCRRVTWQDWQKIDRVEREKGKAKGKEREKFTSVADMLTVLD
jgi:adrenodoxin-NADP+ reductase